MDPNEIVTAIDLGEKAIQFILSEIAAKKAESGLTDDQIADAALARDANVHARVRAALARVGQ